MNINDLLKQCNDLCESVHIERKQNATPELVKLNEMKYMHNIPDQEDPKLQKLLKDLEKISHVTFFKKQYDVVTVEFSGAKGLRKKDIQKIIDHPAFGGMIQNQDPGFLFDFVYKKIK